MNSPDAQSFVHGEMQVPICFMSASKVALYEKFRPTSRACNIMSTTSPTEFCGQKSKAMSMSFPAKGNIPKVTSSKSIILTIGRVWLLLRSASGPVAILFRIFKCSMPSVPNLIGRTVTSWPFFMRAILKVAFWAEKARWIMNYSSVKPLKHTQCIAFSKVSGQYLPNLPLKHD